MSVRLGRSFFDRDTLLVARELLGKTLVSTLGGARVAGRIVECEAYTPDDSTSHAFRGPTPRNRSMFERPGTLYVYFTYGMHFCANLVTERAGMGAAVLLRALEPIAGIETARTRRGSFPDRDLMRGPARLCVALGLDRAADGVDTCARGAAVFVEDAELLSARSIARSPRVGVTGARRDVTAARRWFERDSRWVSGGPRRG